MDTTTMGDREVVAGLATERLEAELVSTAATLAGRTYDLLVLVGEYDHRDAHVAWGHLSCVAWLADLCDIERSTAASYVRVARAMRRFPLLDRAMRDGEVSYAKARVLAAHLTAGNCEELVGLAVVTPAGRLGAAIARWSRTSEDAEVTQLAKAASGGNATAKVAFGTEGGLFDQSGIPTIICGPGSIEQAHKPDEFVALDQVAQCETFLRRLVERVAYR